MAASYLSILIFAVVVLAEAQHDQPASSGILLPPLPTKAGSPFAGALFIQDNGFDSAAYAPLAKQLQQDAPFFLWVGLIDFPEDTPTDDLIDSAMNSMIARMNADGFNGSDTRLLYAFGHGTGSFPLQGWAIRYIANQQKVKPYPAPLKGVILLGSYLQRKYRNITFPTGVLTIAGDMDGMTRITRIAESFYHLIVHQHLPPINYGFPHIVLAGVSHMQFASGAPPGLALELDLKPLVNASEARKLITVPSAAFMALKLGEQPHDATKQRSHYSASNIIADAKILLDRGVTDAFAVLLPIIQAMELEAYHYFHEPCYEKNAGANCSQASPWTEMAQRYMCGLSPHHATVSDIDTLWPVNEVFPHDYLPHIYNQCGATQGCVLNASSVTENAYFKVDEADESLTVISASEQKVKLNSRQRCYEHASITPADFNTTDGGSLCAEINRMAYEHALNISTPANRQRFLASGQLLTMAADKVTPVFPVWSYEALSIDTSGKEAIVTSWASKFDTKNPIPLVSGLHFCKLLSPGRAIEWIYIDGLRKNHSLQVHKREN